jgi:hypothetical protein
MGKKRNTYRVMVGKPNEKTPLGSSSQRWKDSVKNNLKEIGWENVNCIDSAQDRGKWRALVIAVMNLRVP